MSSGAILVLTFSTALATPLPSYFFLSSSRSSHGFVLAGAGAAGDRGAAERAVFEKDVHFNGRIAAGVENLTALNEFDGEAHVQLLVSSFLISLTDSEGRMDTLQNAGVSVYARGIACQKRFHALAPSPGIPGEGWGEGFYALHCVRSTAGAPNPLPNPLPEYREREWEKCAPRYSATWCLGFFKIHF